MPWQLIYTSAPRGLLSGQSGFCTVARSADLREALVQRLEQISSYHYLRVAEAATASRNPTISAFRLLDLRGAKYYVLTRIQPCGLDFTARTNHLAHHLVFQPDELARLPSPAAILRLWPDWKASWQGEPRWLEEVDAASFSAAAKCFLPAQTWAEMTGDAGRAAGLLEGECVRGCYLVCPPGSEEQVLQMYCETLELLNPEGRFPLRPWRYGFTTFLQAEDNPKEFQWRACQEHTPAHKQALTRSAPMIPLQSVRVPANDLVKRARDGPKPLSTPAPASPIAASEPAPKSALKTMSREPSTRSFPIQPTPMGSVNIKKSARSQKPAFGTFNFSINSATLAGLGIFVAVLAALFFIKHHSENRPAEQGSPAPISDSHPAPVAASTPKKESAPMAAAQGANPLDGLVGDGPTYVLTVSNLTNFSLPISSIMRLQNLLHRYDHFDALPSDIQLAVDTDRWDFPPGASMIVGGRTSEQFSASTPGLDCVFDYSEWLAGKGASLQVRATFKNVPRAFSLHFGFSSNASGDPFRLLIVNANNAPAPLLLAGKFVQINRQDVGASLMSSMRDCLFTNFELLAGCVWQLRPYLRPRLGPAQYLYKDWQTNAPVFGCELDLARIARRLQAQREDLKNSLESLRQPLGRSLGKQLELTNGNLESFLIYSPQDLTQSRFLDYLKELKNTAPTNSWIRKWHDRFEADQPDEVSDGFQNLYNLWIDQRPQDQSMLTMNGANGTTNYFVAAWQLLKEREQVQDQLGIVKKRLVDLEKVAYVGLCIVDPLQPKTAPEMIRFEGP